MINLLPPAAKSQLKKEYWFRVSTVWLCLASAALLLGVVLLVPTYVLLSGQIAARSTLAADATARIADNENVKKDLETASKQAKAMIDGLRHRELSNYIEKISQFENETLNITTLGIDRNKDGIAPIRVSGQATNRKALAAFRDSLLTLPEVGSVDLPISNLAKDRDIQFSLTVILKKEQ